MNRFLLSTSVVAALALTACSDDEKSVAELETQALTDVKSYVNGELESLHAAAVALQNAAPDADDNGWNATDDAEALASMKAEWKKARVAYERVEGAIAVLFPDLDASTDERYDGFIATDADENLFDDEVVTGVHGIERILWSDSIPQSVIDFESGLPNYKAAAFPVNLTESTDFKTKLLQKFVDDTATMRDQFAPLALDPESAYRGVMGSVEEQLEKATLAEAGEEESRYAQFTLADMRANVEGGKKIFDAFRAWLEAVDAKVEVENIDNGFEVLSSRYAAIEGDALPAVPESWSSANPSEADLATPFGQLYTELARQSDPSVEGSTVQQMGVAADKLGIPQLPEE